MTGTVPTQDEAQIRQLMDEKATAMRARDAEALVAQYAPSAVKFDLAPPLRKVGPEAQDVNGPKTWFSGFDGSWLITHEHTSTPFYMDGSLKAAVDLQP